ncbi:hypothetical protein E8E14_004945 [Neopestalotiopsis sp. 37M]|nr:hypothetical protein E8E14_004945 [Neopestalotiopsis sp. 37M]
MGNTKRHLASLLTSYLAILSLLAATPALAATKPKNAILLSEVQSLTLRGGAKTAHRRVAAAPQLKCVSHPSLCKLHDVDLMRCTNQGSGYSDEDIQWSCTANLPPTLKLGSTDVICEGYASSDDEYVLKGSCGVEYRLVLTDEGEKRHPNLGSSSGGWGSGKSKSSKADGEGLDWSGFLFMCCFVGVLLWMIYSGCTNARQARNHTTTRRPRNGGGGGGGGGWGPGGGGGGFGGGDWGDDDPPPPYKPSSSSSSSRAGWQPGFFSGAATGAAAGYYAGSRANRQQQQQQNAGSSWFGSSGSPSSSSNNDSSSSSSARYESTGFGSTSRR